MPLDDIRELLGLEEKIDLVNRGGEIGVIPITHNPNHIAFQFCGWELVIVSDGTWYWMDTTGG